MMENKINGQTTMEGQEMKFEDLEWELHEMAKNALQMGDKGKAIFGKKEYEKMIQQQHAFYPLGNGARASILFGKMFYSNGVDTYEAWVVDEELNDERFGDEYDEPSGYLTQLEVEDYINGILEK